GVARRALGGCAHAPRPSSASRSRASSRLRAWDRLSEAVTVSTPPRSRPASRASARSRSCSVSAEVAARSSETDTRVSEVLTCCPPGPLDRENRQNSSASCSAGPPRPPGPAPDGVLLPPISRPLSVFLPPRGSVRGVAPVLSHANRHGHRHPQIIGGRHLLRFQFPVVLHLPGGHLQHQFVVGLQR